MKIFLLVLMGVMCASSRESRPNTNQSSLTEPSDTSTSNKVSITFIATVKSIELLGGRELKVIPVDFDSRFAVTLHIESLTPKEVPFKVDADQNFAIHSPAQLFQVAKEDAIGKKYRFKAVWNGMENNSKFYNLSAARVVDEATPEAVTVDEPANSAADYTAIAKYIATRVLALRSTNKGFESINESKHVHVNEMPFKPVLFYDHGVTKWEPILDAEPRMNKPVYSKAGFSVIIWMVKGDLTWKPRRLPTKIGAYTIDVQVYGPQRSRIQPLIDQIVRETADRFNR